MRILAFSDLHRRLSLIPSLKEKARRAEVVIGAGDFSDFGRGLDEVFKGLSGISEAFFVIPGNNETPVMIEKCCRAHGCKNIHGSRVSYAGYALAGIGGSTPTPFNTPFELTEDEIERILKGFEGEGDLILVAHMPPYGTKLDSLSSGVHVGSRVLRSFIESERPLLVICGHVHERGGEEDVIGDTRIVNPGPKGIILEV